LTSVDVKLVVIFSLLYGSIYKGIYIFKDHEHSPCTGNAIGLCTVTVTVTFLESFSNLMYITHVVEALPTHGMNAIKPIFRDFNATAEVSSLFRPEFCLLLI
jgi:hypothetical protein